MYNLDFSLKICQESSNRRHFAVPIFRKVLGKNSKNSKTTENGDSELANSAVRFRGIGQKSARFPQNRPEIHYQDEIKEISKIRTYISVISDLKVRTEFFLCKKLWQFEFVFFYLLVLDYFFIFNYHFRHR